MPVSDSVPATPRLLAGWALPSALTLLLLVLGLAVVRLAPPSPLPESAPPGEFSAARARAILARLAGDGAPHPLGSPAQTRTRDRVAAEIRQLGYEVREEPALACSDFGNCTVARNLVAELPGLDPKTAVLLASHYDSVGAGPGVSDDLAGVAAILEVARILKAGPPPRHSVLFLLDEGEEGGLLGARGFLESGKDAERIKAVVNLEARGTSGPSLMFETGRANAWLIPLFAGSVPHPRTSSVFPTIYQYLPNDTDFSIFERRGLSGFNFAYIGHPAHYHTPLDNLANTSLASLQHHGENALATVRALAQADLERPHSGQAVFFDFLSLWVFGWPADRGLPLATAALLLMAVTAIRLRRRGLVTGGEIARGALAWLTVFVVTSVAGFVLAFLLRLAGPRTAWPAHGLPGQAAFWLLALAVAVAAAGWFRRAGCFGLWLGGWLVWAFLGLCTALLLPGISYLFLVPVLAAGLAGLFLPGRGEGARLAAVLGPVLLAGALWFPLLVVFYNGLGSPALWLIGGLLAMVLTAILPLGATPDRSGRRTAAVALVGALTFALAAAVLPPYTPSSPQPLNFSFHQDAGTGQARWLATTPSLPPSVSRFASFGRPAPPFPWSSRAISSYAAPAPAQTLPGPALLVVRDETAGAKRHLLLHLGSPRGAASAYVFIPETARLEAAQVAGRPVPLRPDRRGPFRSLQVLGLPPDGVDLDLTLGTTAPQEWYLLDRSAGLPPAGAPLLQTRPAWASPYQDGDVTLVSRKVVL